MIRFPVAKPALNRIECTSESESTASGNGDVPAATQMAVSSGLAVYVALLQAQAEVAADAKRFRFLQNLPVVKAQQYFWNHSSRKQRAYQIDKDMLAAEVEAVQKKL